MRMVFRAPFSFTPASRTELLHHALDEALADEVGALRKAEVLHLRDPQPRIAARIDARKGREIHVDVEREAMVCAAAHDTDAKSGNLRAFDVDARRARLALGTLAEQLDHRLLEQADEALDRERAPRKVD